MFNRPPPLLKVVFAAIAVTAGMVAFGFVSPQDLRYETVNGIKWSYVVENETAKVTNWNMSPAVPSSTTGNVVVPDSLGGYPVAAIGNYAFYQISGITSLTIPEGVETIETYACLKCTGLETVSLPSTLKTMGDAVFSGCGSLLAGAIPDSVTSIGRDTFWECKAMTTVKFSANVASLGAMTCYNCDSLTEVFIPYGVTNIGVSAFLHCDNLRTISIPETATEIGNYAFNDCPLLETLELPGGMTVLRDIFSGCKSLRTIEIPAGVSSITASTFQGCTNMTSITVAEGSATYKSMDGILYDFTGETLVAWPPALPIPASLPQGIRRIGDYVFSGRRDLTAIEIPEGVESIGVSAFDMCQNLSSITLPTTLKVVGERAFFGCSPISSATFYDGFESVGEKAFGRTGITSLVFPSSTALIGVAAFRECASLQSLEVQSSTCSIQSYAFADCPRLVSINIADGANVSSNAFGDPPVVEPEEPSEPDDPSGATIYRDCFRIEPGQIPHLVCTVEGLEGIDYAVDKYASNDWQVVIHGWGMNDARIKKAKPGAHLLDDNDMPSGVHEVTGTAQPFVFEFCNWYRSGALGSKTWYGYASIALDENARLVILESALCNQQNVLTVTGTDVSPAEVTFETKDRGGWLEIMGCIPEDVTGWVVVPSEIDGTCVRVIGEGSFYMHEGITKITLPETIVSIGASAFGRCTSLKECNIPASVTNIGVWAFGDTAISRISVPTSLECIDAGAFSGCKNLSNVAVWPWTQVHYSAFDKTCSVEYTGTVTNFSGFARDVGDDDVTNLMTWVGRENFDGVTEFRVTDDYGELWGNPYGYSKLLYYIGMAPAVTAKNGSVLEAKYVKPRMEIVSFDPATRRITGRVVAQGGCRIVSMPNPWSFGLRCYDALNSEGINNWENIADVSGYTDEGTLGEFTYTIHEDDFSTNKFFSIELAD